MSTRNIDRGIIMINNVIIVIGFAFLLIIICTVWNSFMFLQYENNKKQSDLNYSPDYKMELLCIEHDGNSNGSVEEAIYKIDIPDNIGIKIHDKSV